VSLHNYTSRLWKIYEFLDDYINILDDRYRDIHIELHKYESYYTILIESKHTYIHRIEIIDTYRKHLLIYLDTILMNYIAPKLNKDIMKPEYAWIIYLPIPEDADKITEYKVKNGMLWIKLSRK
jgi:hypothetical protein